MIHYLLLAPTLDGVGLTTVSLGLVRAFEREGIHVGFVKPIAQTRPGDDGPERSTALIRATTHLEPPTPIPMSRVEAALREREEERLLEEVVERVHSVTPTADVVVIEGLVPNEEAPFADQINAQIATALDADVVLVGSAKGLDPVAVVNTFRLASSAFASTRIAGCIVNRVPADANARFDCATALQAALLPCVGTIALRDAFMAPRMRDIQRALGARSLTAGSGEGRRVMRWTVAAMTVPNCLSAMSRGTLIVTPGDRYDVMMAACLTDLGGGAIAGLLLSGGLVPDPRVLALCKRALDLGLPILLVDSNTVETANALLSMDTELPVDDLERIELVMNSVADDLDRTWIQKMGKNDRARRMTAPAFRHRLLEQARAGHRRIVLPEGTEPRTIRAAAQCQARGIARCVLLGEEAKIRHVAADLGVEIPADLEIMDPEQHIDAYVGPMVELRKHKGLTPVEARNALEDTIVLGTMMLARGEVDGLVSGAIHTTAHTVRPALQLIRTAPQARLVSSVFFMCLPEQVLVYGDCAINPDPTAEELADIAIQSADSAQAFGIEPLVALISYSTGSSGEGVDVDKVRQATALARERRPDLQIDGPLQYDAAVMPEVAAQKAPQSPVAGRASVLIFPDLNTGNTTYKAVQRSAKVVSIGPMLQGLAKPVNDLSRGALVEDIVYTIALTAIQANALTHKVEPA